MVVTNLAGIAWTCWQVFGADHRDDDEEIEMENNSTMDMRTPPTAMNIKNNNNNINNNKNFFARTIANWK